MSYWRSTEIRTFKEENVFREAFWAYNFFASHQFLRQAIGYQESFSHCRV